MKKLLSALSIFLFILLPSLLSADGYSVFVCGHSFHQYIDKPLEALAKEAGHADHVNAGKLFVGGSTCTQTWNVAPDKNTAKTALKTGKIDVLTLSPHKLMPDPGIDLWADLAKETNPNIRVLLQVSWSQEMIAKPDPAFWKQASAQYMAVLREQAKAINTRHGRETVYIVPVGPAMLVLWEKINSGEVPGVQTAQRLFSDAALHPSDILKNLVTYCWFAAVYHESPVGLKSLDGGSVSTEVNRILQQIAWDAVRSEPMSGIASPDLVAKAAAALAAPQATPAGVPAGSNSSAAANKLALQMAFDAWKSGTGSPFTLMAPEATWTITGNSLAAGTYATRDEFLNKVIAPFNARLGKPLVPTVRGLYNDGDTVVVLFDGEGVATDGKPYKNTYAWFMTFRDGQIVKVIAFFDAVAFDEFWKRVQVK